MTNHTEFAAFFTRLTQALDNLPGVGSQAAKRLARHLLQPGNAAELAQLLDEAKAFRQCIQCRHYTRQPLCCDCQQGATRELLVVEQADDVLFWREQGYCGGFFVLHGLLSPVAGIGPQQLQLSVLKDWIRTQPPEQLWLCVAASVEGQTTERFITDMLPGVEVISWTAAELAQQLCHSQQTQAAVKKEPRHAG